MAICARDADGVAAAVDEMSSAGTIIGASVDAADGEALTAWVRSSAEQFGGIDIYVHNTSGKPAKITGGLAQQLQHRPDVVGARRRRGQARRWPTAAVR